VQNYSTVPPTSTSPTAKTWPIYFTLGSLLGGSIYMLGRDAGQEEVS